MRMFAIYSDDNIHAICATREAAEWLLDCLMDNDGEQAHTWSLTPVMVEISADTGKTVTMG